MLLKSVFIGFLSLHSVDTNMLKECESKEDKISGCVKREYHDNGKIYWETPFKNGKKEGMEKWYHWNGNLGTETPYKNGKFDGIVKEYYENANLRAEMPFKNDNLHGDLKLYTEDGKLLALIKAENHKFISGKCLNNKALTDKELRESSKIIYSTDLINYLQKICLKESDSHSTLHANTLKECKNEEDKISGCVEKGYYEDGWKETPYQNGKKEGVEKFYYKNGNLQAEFPYLNDKLHGDLKFYTEGGEPLALFRIKNYEFISGKCHSGKVLTRKDLGTEYPLRENANVFLHILGRTCLEESDSK